MSSKPQTGGLAALLRHDKERRAREEHDAERQIGKKMKLKDAAAYLRVSSSKVSKLIKEGTLSCESDPLDKRIKLIRVEELDKLKLASLDKD